MASQVAHIVYAKKFLEKFPGVIQEPDLFFLGSVFPDIRRVDDRITRRETHMRFFPVDLDFSKVNSFEAGWKFHLYCDMKREEILRNADFYDLNREKSVIWEMAAKLVEDELVYNSFNNWDKIIAFFNNPPAIFLPEFVSEGAYHLWYAMLSRYVSQKPDKKSIRIFLNKQQKLPDKANFIIEKFEEIRKNEKAERILFEAHKSIV